MTPPPHPGALIAKRACFGTEEPLGVTCPSCGRFVYALWQLWYGREVNPPACRLCSETMRDRQIRLSLPLLSHGSND